MTEPVKLNVGGGDKLGKEAGYVNIDLRKLPKTDLSATAVSLPFSSGSVDEIVASDVLEHVGRHSTLAALQEWHRVLRHNGLLKIKTPDLRVLAQGYLEGRIDVREFDRKIYGNQEGDDPANFHRSGTDRAALEAMLKTVGFREIRITQLDGADWGNLGCRATK